METLLTMEQQRKLKKAQELLGDVQVDLYKKLMTTCIY